MSSDTALRVDHLSKRYRLGTALRRHDALRDVVADLMHRTVRRRAAAQELPSIIWALKNVSVEVKWGEVVGIVGHNGAGKTTLLKVLSRVTEPTSGRAELYGRVGSLLEVGTGFHPELTGRENVYLSGAILGMHRSEIQRKLDEIVAFAEVEQFIDTPVKRYSSGMQARLGFSVAAHLEQEILIVDEVLAVGDAAFQRKCLQKMGDVAQRGRAVLFVSHNLTALAALCKRAYCLDHGRLVDAGPPVQVIERYLRTDQPQHGQDLAEHPGRRSGLPALLRTAQLRRGDEATGTFFTSGPFALEVECAVSRDDGSSLALGFGIRDRKGNAVVESNMQEYGLWHSNDGMSVRFRASIDRLILSPGTYTLSLSLNTRARVLDVIDNALTFEVLWTPRADLPHPPQTWPLVFLPVEWHAEALNGWRIRS